MVFLLNLIPLLIFLVGAFFATRAMKRGGWKRTLMVIVATIITIWLYLKAQPSYMPKGDIKRTPVPAFVPSSPAEIEDRGRKPVALEERRAQQEQQYRDGPVFLKDAAGSK